MNSDVNPIKERIRAIIRDRRSNLSGDVQETCAEVLCDNLTEYVTGELGLDLADVRIASYMPVFGEISTIPFCRKVIEKGGTVMMPRVEDPRIVFYEVSDLDQDLKPGRFGIPEPVDTLTAGDPRSCDLVIVPAIAFNDEGIRLGQGGGYYDRLWEYLDGESPERKVIIVGVCYDFQIVSSIPVEAHDMTADVLFEVSTEEEHEE